MNEQSLKARLQTISKEKHVPFNYCWKQLVLERFLAKLSRSNESHKYVFKGGFLLACMMHIGRETRDLDFLIQKMKAEACTIEQSFDSILATPTLDNFAFSFSTIDMLDHDHIPVELDEDNRAIEDI